MSGFHTVTGAFGYSRKYIAKRLLARNLNVKTLTNSSDRDMNLRVRFRFFRKERMIISLYPTVGYYSCKILSLLVNDVIITKEEIKGLMDNLLYVDSPPVGKTKLTA